MSISAEYARPSQMQGLFGISEATAYRLLSRRDIRAVKHGRGTYIELASVREYLARRPAATYRPTHNRALVPTVTRAA